jgi:cation diffusion facilitator CzcD-associated flavoprotein CzcO
MDMATGSLPRGTTAASVDVDVLIVGAGISGIGMAVHLQRECPNKSFALVEQRADLGGTWDLFRYPGIRSDSDMHTLGFIFEPWREQKAIADGPSILKYLRKIVDERGIRDKIAFNRKVVAADWDSRSARWTVTLADAGGAQTTTTARFLYMGSGYYDYDSGYDPGFPGRADFKGDVIHPQFWPKDYDYSGKRVVVIGSGATAVTLVPSMALAPDGKAAAHVTMLRRTPTWMFLRPAEDKLANFLRRILPDEWAYRVTRFKNVRLQNFGFKMARSKPEKVAEKLTNTLKKELGDNYDPVAFTPPYNPWEQRLCLVPDNDLCVAINSGKVDIVTDHIDHFDATGITLKSGQHLGADVIVTATGLQLVTGGKVAFRVDGEPVVWNQHFFYKGCMYSNIPNLAAVFGYLNASWTLKADVVSHYICRLINHMDNIGADIANPVLAAGTIDEEPTFDFSSGYIQRALASQPRNGTVAPWRLNQDYLKDRVIMREGQIDDGVLKFSRATGAATEARLEAVE